MPKVPITKLPLAISLILLLLAIGAAVTVALTSARICAEMNNNLTRDVTTRQRFGPGGDTTANGGQKTINSLSEITVPNESLWKLIGAEASKQHEAGNSTNDHTTIVPTTSADPAELIAAITNRESNQNNNDHKNKSTNHNNKTQYYVNDLNTNKIQVSHTIVDDGAGRESSLKRSPEEMVRQLQVLQKKRPTLISSEKTIEAYKNEILQLKLQLYNLKFSHQNAENLDVEGAKKDIVFELMAQNEELRKELEERDRKEKKDLQRKRSMQKESSCQTNLDGSNIEELFRSRRELESIKHNERFKKPTTDVARQHKQSMPTSSSLHNHLGHHQLQQTQLKQVSKQDKETQFPVVSQLIYPHVTLPRTTSHKSSSHDQLAQDEKVTLEKLCHLDGIMTTIKDKMLARLDMSQL